MTQATRTSPEPGLDPRRPDRFQQPPAHQPGGRSVPRLLAAVLAVAGLVVGVPAALLALHGAPSLPTSWPDRATLSHAISAEQLVGVLVVVAWLAWLQFTICLVVELVSAIRGRGLPAVVPLSGPSQRLARALVAAIVIGAVSAGPAAAVTGSTMAAQERGTVATQSISLTEAAQATTQQVEASPADGTLRPIASAAPASSATAHLPAEVRDLIGKKVYVVKAPEGRYHDNLWDIAERHLGDGRRYKEIYVLNQGREQPDGRHLELARLIQPGWQLVLPDDATGVARFDVRHETTGTAPVGERTAARAAEAARDTAGADDLGASATVHSAVQAESQHTAVDRGGLAAGGLLAAGLLTTLVALRRRRGAEIALDPEAEDAEVALRVGADLDRARSVDQALRGLAAASAAHDLPLPAVYAAVVAPDSLELLLAPAAPSAPAGWSVEDGGRRWRVDLAAFDGADDQPAADPPYPGLVAIGRDGEDRDVLIDLDAADGPIALSGDPVRAGEIAVALALGVATSPWADALRVGVTGLDAAVLSVAPQRLYRVDDAAVALRAMVQDAPPPDAVLTGRGGGGVDAVDLLVLAADPGPEALAVVQSRAGREVGGLVIAGDLPDASWRLHVDETGMVEISPLGLRVSGYQVDQPTLRALTALLAQARSEPAAVPVSSTGVSDRVSAPAPGQTCDDADYTAAVARVAVLGMPDVRAAGAMDASRIPLATEVLAYLALHREGVHPTVLGGAIWPRGVGADVLTATVARVRDWLGSDSAGHHLLRELPDGRLALAPEVPCDWDVVCTLLQRAASALDPREETDLLRRALRVVRGPLLAGVPQGRYAWVVRTRLERTVPRVITAAAHRLSVILLDGGPDGAGAAAEAARSGLRVDPGAQVLWRDVLRAEHAAEGPPGVAAALTELRSILRDLAEPLEPETEALVDELSPGTLAEHA